jgi:hypothetical protein
MHDGARKYSGTARAETARDVFGLRLLFGGRQDQCTLGAQELDFARQ